MLNDYKELEDDKVYNEIVKRFDKEKTTGAKIIDNKPYGPKEVRLVIEVLFEREDGQQLIRKFNYKKIQRGIKSKEKYGI